MKDRLWISKDIIEWDTQAAGESIVDKSLWQRSYEIWHHSNNLIENASNDFQLADGITNLKRCLNHRLQLIEELYKFKMIEIENKPKGYLELLQRYGIVRPTIMKTLMRIRNDIEHNDGNPPDVERCREFVDILWYFLKSTDSLVQLKKSDVEFTYYNKNGDETRYSYTARINIDNNNLTKIFGWFPKELIFNEQKDNTFELLIEEIETQEEFNNMAISSGIKSDYDNQKDKLDSDIYISAKVNFEPKDIPDFINKIINSY